MIVKINKSHLDFLIQILSERKPELANVLKEKIRDYKITFEIDSERADEIRDLIEEEIQKKGYDKNYNLNKKGLILQEISDIFYVK